MKFGTLCIIIIFILLFVYVAKTLATTITKGYRDVRTANLANNVGDMIEADQGMGRNGRINRGIEATKDITKSLATVQEPSYGLQSRGSNNESDDYEDLGEFTL